MSIAPAPCARVPPMMWLLASTLRDLGRGAHPAKELQPLDTRRPPCPCGPEESAFPASTWAGLPR